MADTTYNVNVRYAVDNRAGRSGVAELAKDVKELEHSNKSASASFGLLGAAAVAGVGVALHVIKKDLIDFNRDVQNAKIGLSAMVQGNLGGSWDMATEKANKLYTEFQKFSTQTPVTTQEILNFGKGVAVATFQAGGRINDMIKITEQGVIAAKAFGYESNYTALELSEMLSGNINNRMMFAKQMLGIAGVTMEKFRELNAQERLDLVKKTLDSDAFKNAAHEFGESWSGVTSTLEDKLQIIFGQIGLPLFKALTHEVKSWAEWIEHNKTQVDAIGRSIGEGLVTGMHAVKDALSLLVNHAGLLMDLGKIWLAVKIGGLAQFGVNGAAALGAGAGGLFGAKGFFANRAARDSIDPFTGEYKYTAGFKGRGQQDVTTGNIAGNLPLVAQSLAVGVAIGTLINSATGLSHTLANIGIDKTTLQFEKVSRASEHLSEALQRAADQAPNSVRATTNLRGVRTEYAQLGNLARDLMRAQDDNSLEGLVRQAKISQALSDAGIGKDDVSKYGGLKEFADAMSKRAGELQGQEGALGIAGNIAWEIGIRQLTDYQRQTLDESKAQQDLLSYINMSLAKGIVINPQTVMEILRRDTDDPTGRHKATAEKPKVNVHINRIEVQSDDPDRMAFGLIEFFRDAAKNPSSAVHALREG